MYTARDVTLRLRSELHDARLGVKVLQPSGRWVAFVRRKMLTGARRWPMSILDDGAVVPGTCTIQEVSTIDDIVWVCETEQGEYLSLDPNLIRQKLVERDTHARDHAKELFAELARRRAAKQKAFDDEVRARSRHYRRAFARLADEMGIGGRPDYAKLYNPSRISPA